MSCIVIIVHPASKPPTRRRDGVPRSWCGGTSRNAIIGKCTRLGLALTAKGGGRRVSLAGAGERLKPKKVASPRPARPARPPRKWPPKMPRASRPCCLIDLTNMTCRWPRWNEAADAPRLFCGSADAKLHEGIP
jgi:hypothetical protein